MAGQMPSQLETDSDLPPHLPASPKGEATELDVVRGKRYCKRTLAH